MGHTYLVNLKSADAAPHLVTQFAGGNLAANGNGTTSIGLSNRGHMSVGVHQNSAKSNGPVLATQMVGSNMAVTGNGKVSFNVANSGSMSAHANQFMMLLV